MMSLAVLALAGVADGLLVPDGTSKWPTPWSGRRRLTRRSMVMTAPPPDAPAPPPPPPPPPDYTDLMLLTCGGLEDVTCDLVESRLGVDRDGGEFVLEVAAYAALLADGAGGSYETSPARAGFRGGEAAVGKCVLRLNDASRGFDSGRKGAAERSLGELVAELEASCGVQTVVALVCFEQSCFDDAPGDKAAAALAELTNGTISYLHQQSHYASYFPPATSPAAAP